MHQNRKRRHGSYLLDVPPGQKRVRPIADRFWAKVNKSGPESVAASGRCWLWTAHLTPQGYGSFGLGRQSQGKTVAHRVAWELTNGPIPDGLHIDHICGVRTCVNPGHLRTATTGENTEHRVQMAPGNRSGYRGVAWHSQMKKWTAQVYYRGKKHHLGTFVDPQEAAAVAAAKRAELFKFPDFPLSP